MIFPTQKVWLTGVESTGKSTLAAALAQRCDSLWVREYARIYLDALPRDYTQTDIDHIAAGQLRAVEQQLPKANQYLFCDTGMLVLKIWSMHKYGNCSSFIVHQLHRQHGDCHLLCSPKGVKWEYDPLRETPNLNQRLQLHQAYRQALQRASTPYIELEGTIEQRLKQAMTWLTQRRSCSFSK